MKEASGCAVRGEGCTEPSPPGPPQVSTVDSVCVKGLCEGECWASPPAAGLLCFHDCAASILPCNQHVPGQIPNALLDINLTIESRVQQRKFKEAQKRVDKMIMLTCI